MLVDGSATDHVVGKAEAKLELVVGQFQHLDRLGHDFRTNAITWENQNLFAHGFLLFDSSDTPHWPAGKLISTRPRAPEHRC
ncbi:hypothetical protein D3C71_2003950 [compost metagenome]